MLLLLCIRFYIYGYYPDVLALEMPDRAVQYLLLPWQVECRKCTTLLKRPAQCQNCTGSAETAPLRRLLANYQAPSYSTLSEITITIGSPLCDTVGHAVILLFY